jgi:formylglycine-generating enzyme required for sulfatase activity
MQQFDAQPMDAGFAVDWYDSVSYCRWLGQQSGLSEAEQAYAAPESLDKELYPREPNPKANWAPRNWPLELGRHGFRLPTESEWEIATRSGARTAYGYGSDENLLGRFGWFNGCSGKRVHPPRELRPNVRGLYDLHGNLAEWNHDWFDDFSAETVTDPLGAKKRLNGFRRVSRVTRGGNFDNDAAHSRAANRGACPDPTVRTYYNGFRLALSPSVESPEARKEQQGARNCKD